MLFRRVFFFVFRNTMYFKIKLAGILLNVVFLDSRIRKSYLLTNASILLAFFVCVAFGRHWSLTLRFSPISRLYHIAFFSFFFLLFPLYSYKFTLIVPSHRAHGNMSCSFNSLVPVSCKDDNNCRSSWWQYLVNVFCT